MTCAMEASSKLIKLAPRVHQDDGQNCIYVPKSSRRRITRSTTVMGNRIDQGTNWEHVLHYSAVVAWPSASAYIISTTIERALDSAGNDTDSQTHFSKRSRQNGMQPRIGRYSRSSG